MREPQHGLGVARLIFPLQPAITGERISNHSRPRLYPAGDERESPACDADRGPYEGFRPTLVAPQASLGCAHYRMPTVNDDVWGRAKRTHGVTRINRENV
jgi:hypothetical protein